MKSKGLLWLLGVAPLALLPFTGGCSYLEPPEPEATPTPVPKPTGIIFRPQDGQPRGTALNKLNDAVLPDAFRVAYALSGDELVLQTAEHRKGKDGRDQLILGTPDVNNPVRLAGIVAPKKGQIGYEQSISTLTKWTVPPNAKAAATSEYDLDVDLDPRYPIDIDNLRLVHVFFKGHNGPNKDKLFSLNRMMVRSGFAIVDLYSPTSFDQTEWLFDETYARTHKPYPLGLWPTNIFRTLQQRSYTISYGTGAKSKVTIQTALDRRNAKKPSAITSTTTTTQTTTTQPAVPVGAQANLAPTPGPGVPGATLPAPAPGVPTAPSRGTTAAPAAASSG